MIVDILHRKENLNNVYVNRQVDLFPGMWKRRKEAMELNRLAMKLEKEIGIQE